MKRSLRIGLVQAEAVIGETEANLAKIAMAADGARRKNADIICFGEGFVQGYVCTREARRLAQPLHGPAAQKIVRIAEDTGCSVVTGILESARDSIYSSCIMVEPNGAIHGYRKAFLGPHERPHFSRGRTRGVVQTKLGKIGMMICYDAFFPEISRELAENGAEIVLCPSATAISELEFSIFIAARAAENRFFLAFANLVGWREQIKARYFGRSRIMSPDGTVAAMAKRLVPDTIYAIVPDKTLRRNREFRPLLKEVHEQYRPTR